MRLHRSVGFTLVEIMIVVSIIGLLTTIALPNFASARNSSRASVCINNLHQINAAKEQLTLETNMDIGDALAANTDLDPYIRGGYAGLECPSNGTYTPDDIGIDPTCDIAGHVLP